LNSAKKVYIFVGPPGSGKGTLSQLCVQRFNWVQLSTGNLCRKHILEGTQIGKQIDFAIKSGKLVSDSLITTIVEEWFSEIIGTIDTIILDGYPRTVAQAIDFNQILKRDYDYINPIIVRFVVSDEQVVARICGRYVCQNKECQAVYSLAPGSNLAPKVDMVCDRCGTSLGRRSDDAQEAVRQRLAIYHKHEQDLLHFYLAEKYPIIEVAGEQPLDVVFSTFKEMVGAIPV
jgi:adenylate kinase